MVLRDCVRDLRYSWRQFAATPMVACVAVITLAIGIGANAAIFSLLDTALLQTLPVHDPGSLRTVERSEEHTSELQSRLHLVCRLLLEKKKTTFSHLSWRPLENDSFHSMYFSIYCL